MTSCILNKMDCAVYIMTNAHRTVLYTGVTSNLGKRILQHKNGIHPSSFTHRYNVDRLVFYELSYEIESAIALEKRIKGWTRAKKIELIESMNPEWKDLAADWEWDYT